MAPRRQGKSDRSGQPRQRARAQPVGRTTARSSPPPSSDLGQLLQQLQVQRMELETENRELREAKQELEESRDRFADLYDNAPVGYLVLDKEGVIKELNLTSAGLLGRERQRLLQTPFASCLSGEDERRFREHLRAVFETRDRGMCDVELKSRDGGGRCVRLQSVFTERSPGTPAACRAALVDMGNRPAAPDALTIRMRQQALVAELGQRALAGLHLDALCDDAVMKVTVGLQVEFAKVLELVPNAPTLRLRAGVGWKEGAVGQTTVSAGMQSQAGYTLASDQPVVVLDLREETRFNGPTLLHDHGVISGMSVVIQGREGPFGVLGAHTSERRTFSKHDINFLQAVANILAAEIERKRAESALRDARDALEERVEKRTAQLSSANHKLRRETAERERGEVERERLLEKVASESARLKAVLQRMPAGVVIAEAPSGRLVLGNDQVEQIWLHPFIASENIAGWQVYRGFHPDGRPYSPHEWPLARSIQKGEVVEREEIGILRGNDTRGVIEVSSAPIRDADGRITAGVVIFSDITERKWAESAAREHQAQLAHVLRLSTVGEMATGVAHEVNQPLTAMVTYSQACLRMMGAKRCNETKLRDTLQEVATQGLRAGEIIRRLRAFTRMKETRRSTASFNDLVQEVVKFVAASVRENQISLKLRLGRKMPDVVVDTIQIEQVILNLLVNAIEAMEGISADRRVLVIRTRSRGRDGVELTIRDTGPGLPGDGNQRVFDPFFTTKPHGMGMGLSISRSIVEAHNGRLWAETPADQGAMLHLVLPSTRMEAPAKSPLGA